MLTCKLLGYYNIFVNVNYSYHPKIYFVIRNSELLLKWNVLEYDEER